MRRSDVIGLAAAVAIGVLAAAKGEAQAGASGPRAFVDAILRSGTARSFTDQRIDDSTIDLVVRCGIRAPSARNAQPWHFTVVQSKEMLTTLRQAMTGAGAQARGDPFFGSSTIIIISGTRGWESAQFDCALACQSMALAAQSLGLGAHISTSAVLAFQGSGAAKALRTTLGIPDRMDPVAVLVIGVPDSPPDAVSSASTRDSAGVVTYVR